MPAQKGRLYVIKLNTTGTTYVPIGGMREPSISINNEPVDVTTADDSGIQTLLASAGIFKMDVSANGVFVEDTVVPMMRALALANAEHKSFQVVCPGTTTNKTYQGKFMITSFEENGTYNSSVNYSIKMTNDGPVTLT